jgi:hypothetical protein
VDKPKRKSKTKEWLIEVMLLKPADEDTFQEVEDASTL